ncbi:hypothetical protein T484DRAFT_1965021 [Baffinella frigidus]|nr:hypothetical protein T484DRAFT_1965021 [Cryptophyta sp. CCMP2293]
MYGLYYTYAQIRARILQLIYVSWALSVGAQRTRHGRSPICTKREIGHVLPKSQAGASAPHMPCASCDTLYLSTVCTVPRVGRGPAMYPWVMSLGGQSESVVGSQAASGHPGYPGALGPYSSPIYSPTVAPVPVAGARRECSQNYKLVKLVKCQTGQMSNWPWLALVLGPWGWVPGARQRGFRCLDLPSGRGWSGVRVDLLLAWYWTGGVHGGCMLVGRVGVNKGLSLSPSLSLSLARALSLSRARARSPKSRQGKDAVLYPG